MNLDTGEPTDQLTNMAIDFCKKHGSEVKTLSEYLASKDEKITKAIQDGIDRYNGRAISRAQKVGLLTFCYKLIFYILRECNS